MFRRLITASISTALLGAATPAQANIIGFFDTIFDTDFTAAGVGGFRGTGNGTIEVTGVTGSVSEAILYWHGPTNSTDPGFNANIVFNGNAITGTNIGFSDDNFWNQDNSQAYRADVSSFVAGNGSFSLAGLESNHSNGASLLIFFDDGDSSNNRDIVLFDGNDANFDNAFDPLGWDVTLAGINFTSGTAEMVLSVSDGQTFPDAALVVNGTTIDGPGAVFQGDTVPATPGTSVTNGALWDIRSFDVTSFLSPGPNTLNLTHGAVDDALSLINVAINLPAGAAPPPPPPTTIPEPATLWLFLIAMCGILSVLTIAAFHRQHGASAGV